MNDTKPSRIAKPLHGLKVVEFEAIGPGPLAARFLADMGAQVTVVTRKHNAAMSVQLNRGGDEPFHRGKTVMPLDLKQAGDVATALELVGTAEALIEGNRPGVMERLGLGPRECAARNPRLVYGRMTGWGQDGPLSQAAGHDLNYVALTGVLSLVANAGQRPIVPPTVLGDAAGALGLVFGIVCAVLDARSTGQGRVVDAAIIDVVAMLSGIAFLARAGGALDAGGPSPFHDSPFYDVYRCADGKYVSVGALEPQFYALLLNKLGLNDLDPSRQWEVAKWPVVKGRLAELFATRDRAHWCALLEGTDACFAPVLSFDEAAAHPHNTVRQLYRRDAQGCLDSVAAPRFCALPEGEAR